MRLLYYSIYNNLRRSIDRLFTILIMKFLYKIHTVLGLALLLSTQILAQTITGKIIDQQSAEPIIGASIVLRNTTMGTITDSQGRFTLQNTDNADVIEISSIGYQAISKQVSENLGLIYLKPSLKTLNQIVVSANRDAQERKEVPVAIESINAQTIDDAKPTSADQVLNKVSGVYMVDLGNEQHMMAIRQPISTKSIFLYMEDGIPIRTSGVFNHNALLEINLAATKAIEVIRGPYSSIYGSEAIGGAINFITPRPTAVPVGKLSIQGSNRGYKRTDFSFSNTFDKVGVYIGGYYATRRNGYRKHSDFDKLSLTGKVNYNISKSTAWNNAFTYIDYVSDMTGSLDSAHFFGQKYSSQHTFTNRDVTALRFHSDLIHRWNTHSKTKLILLYRNNSIKQNPSYRVKDDKSYSNPIGNSNLAHGEVNDNSFNSYGFIAQHYQIFSDAVSVTGGISIDASPNTYIANYISIHKTDDGIYDAFTKSDSVKTDYEVNLFNAGAFVQGEIKATDKLKFTAAIRYDAFSYDYSNNLGAEAFSGAPDSKNTFSAFTPKIGFTYDLGSGSGIYANYSRGFVPPQVGELYRGVKVPTLEPTQHDNFELGGWVSIIKGIASFDFAVYQLNGSNEIIQVKADDGSLENRNAGETKHQGIEYGIHIKPVNDLAFRFSGSNAKHEFTEYAEKGNEYNGNEMPSAPNWIVNSELTYRPSQVKGLKISIEWQKIGKYYMDAANTAEYEGFSVFNVRLGYKIKGFDLWVNTLNVGDKIYATRGDKSKWGTSYNPGDPRTLNVGLGYTFK